MKPILYIAGPMTGLPEFNYPAFFKAEEDLRAVGYHRILNPARCILEHGSDYHEYMRAGLEMVLRAEALAMLPGSHASSGARLERYMAEALGMECLSLNVWLERAWQVKL